MVHVTVDDLSSQTLTVAALPHWGGAVALSPPGADPPTTRFGAIGPAAPLTPTAITWQHPAKRPAPNTVRNEEHLTGNVDQCPMKMY